MNEFVLNLIIAIGIFIGFFAYWGRVSGWYKEGGFVYEFFKETRIKKQEEKKQKKASKNKNN